MAPTVTFADNLTGALELLRHIVDKPFVSSRVVVNRRLQNQPGAWALSKVTEHKMTIQRTAANHCDDSAGRRSRVVVHGPLGSEAGRDGETYPRRTSQVVVEERIAEVSRSMHHGTSRRGRQTAPDATTENQTW